MLKTVIVAGGLALAGLSMAPMTASAASFGNQPDVGASAATAVEEAQYGYRRRYYARRYYAPRRYYRPRVYGGYRYRPRPRYYGY